MHRLRCFLDGSRRGLSLARHGAARDVALIATASAALVLLFAVLGWLGLPFGLSVVPMGEDNNWILILRGGNMPAQAQAFWAMNDRNPLSPWWYIAAQRLYAGLPNGPLLTRLAVNPLLALATYAFVRAAAGGGRPLALAAAATVALSSYSGFVDQIHWNFLGALSLTLLSVAAFGAWLTSGRRTVGWYGASLCCWFAAFASYTFQVGGVLAVALLSFLDARRRAGSSLRALPAAAAETAPFAVLLVLFVLVWTTTRNPAMSAYYELRPDMLLGNLPRSLGLGLWPERYAPLLRRAATVLGVWLPPLVAAVGLATALAVRAAMRDAAPRAGRALPMLGLAACVVLPTALIESMSATWSVGMRWQMVDQAWQPLLWLGLGWLMAAARPRPSLLFPVLGGATAALAVALSLGHNAVQTELSATEASLHRGVAAIAERRPADGALHVVVLVEDGVSLASLDVMNLRTAPAWFGDDRITLRTLRRGYEPTEASHAAWWTVQVGEDRVENAAIGGGSASFDEVAFARFDGRKVELLERLTEADTRGYPVAWLRREPLTLDLAPSGCARSWRADQALPMRGFRASETSPEGPFRWMVANPAQLTLVAPCDGPAVLRIAVALALAPEQWRTLSVRVGGIAVPVTEREEEKDAVVVRALVPDGVLRAGRPTPVELRVDELRTVPGTDIRLGVAFRTLRLAPPGEE